MNPKKITKKSLLEKRLKNVSKMQWIVGGLVVIIALQFLNNMRLTQNVSDIAAHSAQVIDEVGQMRTFVNTFGTDLNEVREFLLLPTHDYGTLLDEGDDTEEGTDDPIVDLFDYIEKMGEEAETMELYNENATHLDAYLNAQETLAYFSSHGLSLRNGLEHHLASDQGTTLLTIVLEDDGTFTITDYRGEALIEGEASADDFKENLQAIIENDLTDLNAYVAEIDATRQELARLLTEYEPVTTALSGNELTVQDEGKTESTFYHEVATNEGDLWATFTIDKTTGDVWMDDSKIDLDEESFTAILTEALESYDTRTELEKKVDELHTAIESLSEDDGFFAVLEKYDMMFSFNEEETDTTIDYYLMDLEENVIQIIYISKETGELMVREPEFETGSLLSSLLTTEKKTMELPETVTVHEGVLESEDDVNILIAGKHGYNVDTIIFANVDTSEQTVHLVSIPRDLYYNGRKINSVYADYGMEEMARQISDIAGYRVDQYILVDMYVFSDLVDLVGGVDVTLAEDLVDPTYKVYENGLASTLYYPAGEHHFDGVEALRIARSRHTTSDYSRAERQQLILEGLQDKAQDLGFGDATTVVDLFQTVIDQTETNISVDEAFTYYLRYRNYDLDHGYVVSSGNVLDSVKLPVNFETSAQVEVCEDVDGEQVCEMSYAVYTLMPRDENWDYIKWYFSGVFE